MSSNSNTAGVRRVKPGPAQFLGNQDVDMLMSMVVALAGELAVVRDRLDTHERLSEAQGQFGTTEVDQFRGDAAVTAQRNQARAAYLRRVLRGPLERAHSEADQAPELVIDELVSQLSAGGES